MVSKPIKACHGKDSLMDRREIEGLIAHGRKIFVLNDMVIKADCWLPYHPGGTLAIEHMVGRDATDEIVALHSRETVQRMKSYQIGRIDYPWKNFVPPIRGGHFRPTIKSTAVSALPGDQFDGAEDISTSGSSEEPTPTFDAADKTVQDVRNRRSGQYRSRRHSSTSVSSIDLGETVPKKLSHVDHWTREERKLDIQKYPSLDEETQGEIVRKYRLLNERIRAAGLYQCRYSQYAPEIARYFILFGASLTFLHYGYYSLAGLFLGCFWHQLVFTAHDAGHMGITHNFTIDTAIGIFIADFIGGLSLGWWKRSHNVHHIVTNAPGHDPDIEHLPAFSVTSRYFESLHSTFSSRIVPYDAVSRFLVPRQHYLYYPILCLGRFNLYVESWYHLYMGLSPQKGPARWVRWAEVTGQVFFWAWFGYGILYRSIPTHWDRFVFVMVSHIVTMPLHVQITLSHFAMSTTDVGAAESFPQKMLRTTMDIECPQWLDFFHGGLQFQAIHHLYPRIPRHNLRQAQKMVQEFCDEVGIPYALYGFVGGNKMVIGRLGEVANQARILAECQRHMVAEGLAHSHT